MRGMKWTCRQLALAHAPGHNSAGGRGGARSRGQGFARPFRAAWHRPFGRGPAPPHGGIDAGDVRRDNRRHVRSIDDRRERDRPAAARAGRRGRRAAAAPIAWRGSRATPCSWRSAGRARDRTSTASSAPSSRRGRGVREPRLRRVAARGRRRPLRAVDGVPAMDSSTPATIDWDAIALPREAMAAHLHAYRSGWQETVEYDGDDRAAARAGAGVQRRQRHCLGDRRAAGALLAQPGVDRARVGRRLGLRRPRGAARPSRPRRDRPPWRCTSTARPSRASAKRRRQAALEERNRLARDIHDTLTQGFAAILMQLQAAQRSTGSLPPTVATAHRNRRAPGAHAHDRGAPFGRRSPSGWSRRGVAARCAAADRRAGATDDRDADSS